MDLAKVGGELGELEVARGDVLMGLDDVAPRPQAADGTLDDEPFGGLCGGALGLLLELQPQDLLARFVQRGRLLHRAAARQQQVGHVDDPMRLIDGERALMVRPVDAHLAQEAHRGPVGLGELLVEHWPPLAGPQPQHVVGVAEVAVVLGELAAAGVGPDLGLPVVAPVLAQHVLGVSAEAFGDKRRGLRRPAGGWTWPWLEERLRPCWCRLPREIVGEARDVRPARHEPVVGDRLVGATLLLGDQEQAVGKLARGISQAAKPCVQLGRRSLTALVERSNEVLDSLPGSCPTIRRRVPPLVESIASDESDLASTARDDPGLDQ